MHQLLLRQKADSSYGRQERERRGWGMGEEGGGGMSRERSSKINKHLA
jgi:hypothetical protein